MKITARTAANSSGSTISLTAAERDDDDHRRRDDAHEAPGPDPESAAPRSSLYPSPLLPVTARGWLVCNSRTSSIPGDCIRARGSSDPDDAMRSGTAYGDRTRRPVTGPGRPSEEDDKWLPQPEKRDHTPFRRGRGEGDGADQGSDSVELKLTVPESDRARPSALEMDPLDAQIRQVFFFDTPDLRSTRTAWSCAAAGYREGDDSVVKLRPVVPTSSRASSGSPTSGSRSTRCPEATSAPDRSRGPESEVERRPWGVGPLALLEGAAGFLRRARPGGTRAR